MGSLDAPFDIGSRMMARLPSDICIVASNAELERLGKADPATQQFRCVALEPGEPLPPEVIAQASLLVMQVDPAERSSLRRIDQVRAARPSLPLIVALHDVSVPAVRSFVRQGVNDVCTLPFNLEELTGQLLDLASQLRKETDAQAPLAPLVTMVRSTGGCGATTIVTHLASALAASGGLAREACVIDLDIQFGNIATSLGCSGKNTVLDLLEAGHRLDTEFLRSAVIDSGRGFDLIAAPDAITPLEAVNSQQLSELLGIARREYGAVLVDLPANWTNWTLSLALASTDLLLVTDLTIEGLRQAKRRLQLFDSIGVPADRIRIVVNRVEKRLFKAIGVDEVRLTLGRDVDATLTAEPAMLSSAQDQGLLASEVSRKSRFASDVAGLAQHLLAGWRQ